MKRYDSYKDSGIEWIGEIPVHWEINKFGRATFFQEGPGLRNWQFTESGIKVICVTNIVPPYIDFSKMTKYISEEEYETTYKHFTVNKGDIMLASSGASWGKVAEYIEEETVILNTSTIRLNEAENKKVKKEFIKWIIQSAYISESLNISLTGSCQPNFGPTHLNKLTCVYPISVEEQTAIANYLDLKTSQIDDLITKKERLIQLLEEERTAIINQAVTKGLDPTVPMKDSGIEWMGEIPAHWEVKKLKYLLEDCENPLRTGPFGSQLKSSDMIENGEFVVYNQRNVLDKQFSLFRDTISKEKFDSLSGFEVFENDILLTTRGTIGKAAMVSSLISRGILHPCLIKVRVNTSEILREWLLMYINNSSYFLENVKLESNSTTIEVIYGGTLLNIVIPVPPILEQDRILIELTKIEEKFSNLIQGNLHVITLMKEFRQTIISEAVTGKIDLRDWQTINKQGSTWK